MIKGETGDWEIVLGLEVHAQVISDAKLFSGAPTTFGADPNTQVSLVDAGMPGMLPVINKRCVEQAVRTGLGLNAKINLRSVFDRKNYFYADLPAGYQISQYKDPIVGEGEVEIDLPDGKVRKIGIERLHLEQDAAKSLHDQHPSQTYVDLNRSGVALMEIVSKPDMRTADEAAAYLTKLRSIVRYLGTCDGNMDEGSMRCDVNVSVRKPNGPLGTRCEIKNVNSIRFVKQAIEYEARRQVELIEGGGKVVQETRLFDPGRGETRSLRSKEDAHDYRYFPDPDLLPLILTKEYVEKIRGTLPELPDARKNRYIGDFGLSPYDAGVLIAEKETAEFFETVAKGRDAKQAANWVTGDFFGMLNRRGVADRPVAGERGQSRQASGPHRRRHDLGPHRQGPVRRHGGDGQGSRDLGRGARPEAGDRHRRHRGRHQGGDRRQSRPARGLQGQAHAVRLVRRPGDEVDRRQGQSQGRQRAPEEGARRLGIGVAHQARRQHVGRPRDGDDLAVRRAGDVGEAAGRALPADLAVDAGAHHEAERS